MDRRRFLASLSSLAALDALPASAAADREVKPWTTSNAPPRKVRHWHRQCSLSGARYPGLRNRLDQLAGIVDRMATQAQGLYGRGLDLAILPETAVTGEAGSSALDSSVPFDGEIKDFFTRKAREHSCYIVVPTYLLDSKEKKRCSNAAILVGRKGEVLGTYRRVHLVRTHSSAEPWRTRDDSWRCFARLRLRLRQTRYSNLL